MISKIWSVVWQACNDSFDKPGVFGLGMFFGVALSVMAHFLL